MRLSVKLGVLCALTALAAGLAATLAARAALARAAEQRQDEWRQSAQRGALALYEKRLADLRGAAQRVAGEIAGKILTAPGEEGGAGRRDGAAQWARMQDLLPRAQAELSLDFVIITDPAGRVLARHNDRPAPGETLMGPESQNPLVARVIAEAAQQRQQAAAAAAVEPAAQVARLGLDVMARVARADQSAVEEALMIEAAAPITSGGRLAGVAVIGQMLNTYHSARAGATALQMPLVAELEQHLFGADTREAGALVALGDTVVASSLPPAPARGGAESEPLLKGARRAAGEPLHEEMTAADQVYTVSWQPIRGADDAPLGALGAARPAEDFEPASTLPFLLASLLLAALAGAAGYLYGRSMAARLQALADAASRMSVGELSTSIQDAGASAVPLLGALDRDDEIGRLTRQLDLLRQSFRQAAERLRRR